MPRFREGGHLGLVSCAALERGFDAPETRVMIDCYPLRRSVMSLLQRYGRVIRAAEGKKLAHVLDLAGNYPAFQSEILHFNAHGVEELGENRYAKAKRPKELKRKAAVCHVCSTVYEPRATRCHVCMTERLEKPKPISCESRIERRDGKLVVVDGEGNQQKEWRGDLWSQLYSYWRLHRAVNHETARKRSLAQYKKLRNGWPRASEPQQVLVDPVIADMARRLDRQFFAMRRRNRRQPSTERAAS